MKNLIEYAAHLLYRITITPTFEGKFEVAASMPSKLGGYETVAVAVSDDVEAAAAHVFQKIYETE